MRKISLLLILAFSVFIIGCGNNSDKAKSTTDSKQSSSTTLKIGATAVPHAEILDFVKPMLAKDGVDLEIVEMADYIRPNLAVSDKELDANYFQHIPYLEEFAKEHNLSLAIATKVHIEPMGIYSQKIKTLDEIPDGASVAIPNDPTNGGRALLLLEKAKLITLKPGAGITATIQDIVENPRNLQIQELEAPQLPRSFEDVTIAVINTNYALDAKLNPTKDALFIEQSDSPYVNILVVRTGDEKRPEIEKLAKVLTSDEVKKFINDKYKGAILPAF